MAHAVCVGGRGMPRARRAAGNQAVEVRRRVAHRDERHDDEPRTAEDPFESGVAPRPRRRRGENVNIGKERGERDRGDEGVDNQKNAPLRAAVVGAENRVEHDDPDEHHEECHA